MMLAIETVVDESVFEGICRKLFIYCSENKCMEEAELSQAEERWGVRCLIYLCPCGREYILPAGDRDLK